MKTKNEKHQNIYMYVVKRDGRKETVHFDKITTRIQNLCDENNFDHVNAINVAQKTIVSIHDGVTTEELDHMSANICDQLTTEHPQYRQLGGAILVSNLHKKTPSSFSDTITLLYNFRDSMGTHCPLVNDRLYSLSQEHRQWLDDVIDYRRDFRYDYFGFKTLERSYLMKINEKVVERPQNMLMRVALAIHGDDLVSVKKSYEYMSQGYMTHATPTLFNAGTNHEQLSSCFLLGTEDSLEGIFKTITGAAKISKWAGGIGIHVSNIRAKGSLIRGTNGMSTGLVPMLKTYESVARYINQGSKRNGSIAVYLEPWHGDVMEFLELRRPVGEERQRTRDLYLAIWMNDLFMERLIESIETNKEVLWSLMCPDQCPGLQDAYGDDFKKLYTKYEDEGRYIRRVPVTELWMKMLESQIEGGMPYVGYKDHVNRKTNQSNVGTIRSSNLCIEIMEYSDDKEYAVCNLASIALPRFVRDGRVDYEMLAEVSRVACCNLNRIIDVNYYPTEETKRSNLRHRPIGIGVQGLADLFQMLKLPFESDEAKEINKNVMEAIYYGAIDMSIKLAERDGHYETFPDSPFSRGRFQFDLWGISPSNRWDWDSLRARMMKSGTRNSLLTALMPTASTSQILGNTESFEPITSNIYRRRTLAGDFTIINKYLIEDLFSLGLWNDEMRKRIIYHRGSVQKITEIPKELREVYKTVWEISQKTLIDMAADRGPYVDQSQSMNIYIAQPDSRRHTSAYIYAWRRGLKTGGYYFRSQPASDPKQFSLDSEFIRKMQKDDECLNCSA